MREFLLLAVIVALAIAAVLRPKIGVFAIVWFSLMRPDIMAWTRQVYPYALILEAGTLIGSIACLNQANVLRHNLIFRLLLILQIPLALSVVLAVHPSLCYDPYWWYCGSIISAVFIPLLIQTEADFRRLIVVAAISVEFLGARFGLFGLIHGGVRFNGGYGGSLSDNNTMALALVMGIPLGWFAKDLIKSIPIRVGLLVAVFLNIAAVVFTFSRGAAISLVAVFLVMIAHSRHRLLFVVGLVILTVPSVYMVKDTYFDRMETLKSTDEAEKDESIMGRVEASNVALRMWEDYPLIGVGFGNENERALWFRYVDQEDMFRGSIVIHNTYLQMLVDSGTFALLAYVALLGGTIILMGRSCSRLKRAGSSLYHCPLAIQCSLIAFAVGSTFLTRITFDFTNTLLMMGASWLIVEPAHLESLRERQEAAAEQEEAQLLEVRA